MSENIIGKAKVHGIEGVELTAREASYSDKNDVINRTFVAQLTDPSWRPFDISCQKIYSRPCTYGYNGARRSV